MEYNNDEFSLFDLILSILKSSMLVLFCILIQYSSAIYGLLVSENIEFKRKDQKWVADVSSLRSGSYYVSIGRPRGLCNLYLDSRLLGSTSAVDETSRESLLFGASFKRVSEGEQFLAIECKSEGGFSVSLMHPPIVAKYQSGINLQFWRAVTELALGPLFSFVLLLILSMMTFVDKINLKPREGGESLNIAYLVFAFISFVYSLSLAYYTRIFIDGFDASLLHITLRTAFNVSLLVVVGLYSKHRPLSLICLSLLSVVEVVTGTLRPELLDRFDDFAVTALPIVTFFYLRDIFLIGNRNRIFAGVKYIVITRFILQLVDVGIVWFNVGVYLAPSSLAMIAMMVLVLKTLDDHAKNKVSQLSKEVLSILEVKKRVQDQVSDLARIAFRETSFTRFSAYVDSFSIGRGDRPYETMIRVIEHGYKKDTGSDRVVKFREMRGMKMKLAIDSGNITIGQGEKDGAYFINVPLGKHACLNLSNDMPKPAYQAYESFETLKNLHVVLSSINDKLVDYGLKQGAALQKLRSKRGDGTWNEEFGVTFVDVNEYSTLSERYGNSFGEFISAKYLPALCKVVGPWAVRESSRGDEVYLVSIKDMIEVDIGPTEAVLKTIEAIRLFVKEEGRALCQQAGFVPVTMSVAAGIGEGSIVCDPLEVRTAGEIINETHRILSAAPPGAIVLHSNLVSRLDVGDIRFNGTETPVLIKKNFIVARTLDERISA